MQVHTTNRPTQSFHPTRPVQEKSLHFLSNAQTMAAMANPLPSSDDIDPYEELQNPKPEPVLEHPRFGKDSQLLQVLAGQALGVGAKGSGVRRLQQSLVDMSFLPPKSADGSYGKQTQKAVANFQRHASKLFGDISPSGELCAATLRALEQLAPAPGEIGQQKNLPLPYFEGKSLRVVVAKDEHRTFLFDKRGSVARIFLNAVGAPATQTAEGLKVVSYKIDEKGAVATGKRLWGGPVFGVRIIDLSWADGTRSGEELHGTDNPAALGEDVSHGCIRHSNPDIIELYDALKVGDRVAIVGGIDDKRLYK